MFGKSPKKDKAEMENDKQSLLDGGASSKVEDDDAKTPQHSGCQVLDKCLPSDETIFPVVIPVLAAENFEEYQCKLKEEISRIAKPGMFKQEGKKSIKVFTHSLDEIVVAEEPKPVDINVGEGSDGKLDAGVWCSFAYMYVKGVMDGSRDELRKFFDMIWCSVHQSLFTSSFIDCSYALGIQSTTEFLIVFLILDLLCPLATSNLRSRNL
ncbi:uncharacterized protein LOC132603450 isoform X1 [Lycium barbarum]|uniref:uncharacterized protein LOC132603450 isoform X1 n=1 Tax=Lycium barbarum TaxID=112863 RepID=UPI00293EBE22|nr:uncharacterized protein LOC132603450 isoform X1 [Lycium barbarum]